MTFYTRSDDEVQKFLAIDCNTRVSISETQTALDSDFFIQGWEFEIIGNNDESGLIVKETLYLFQQEQHTYIPA